MTYYYQNRKRARTFNTDPTMTDQSQAQNTDINIIINRLRDVGTPPPRNFAVPMSGDFTGLPKDLRSLLELAKSANEKRRALPAPLRDMPIDQLINLTTEQLHAILTPPAKPPAQETPEEPKN